MKKKRIIICSLVVMLLLATVWIIWENNSPETGEYTVCYQDLPESFDGYRIAQISDLHNAEMGKNNEKIIKMLVEAKPDMIAITGDLIDSRRTDIAVALAFAEEAVKIAPCYYVTGNHEARIENYDELKSGLEALGVTVLDNEKTQIVKDGEAITLMGIMDPQFDKNTKSKKTVVKRYLRALRDDGDGFTVLLSHRPEVFEVYVDYEVELVLSGHVHGGQFRIPFIGGLYVPNQGFFPKYDAGLYSDGDTNMIISRGIGNSAFPFRINNRPEVVIVELKTAK